MNPPIAPITPKIIAVIRTAGEGDNHRARRTNSAATRIAIKKSNRIAHPAFATPIK